MRAAQPVRRRRSANLGAGQIVDPNPGGGSFMCPVFGAAYTDDFGGPSGHPGIDMFVPIGTQAFAVKSGTVRYVPNEGAGGNTAYLLARTTATRTSTRTCPSSWVARARCHRAR